MNPVYEMRTYRASPGKLEALIARFRDRTEPLFKRHHLKTIGYWAPRENPNNILFYIMEHESREAAVRNWDAFRADKDWSQLRADTEGDGPLVDSIDSSFMDKIAIS
jgi:hypothetical protein